MKVPLMPPDFSNALRLEKFFGKIILLVVWILKQAWNDHHLSVNLCLLTCRYIFFSLSIDEKNPARLIRIHLAKGDSEVPQLFILFHLHVMKCDPSQ